MAITVELAWDEGPAVEVASAPSRELLYVIFGTADREEALTALAANCEPTCGGLLPARYAADRNSETTWRGSVQYGIIDISGGSEPPLKVGDAEFSMDTSGGTRKMFKSLETVDSAGVTTKVPDFGGLIGVIPNAHGGNDVQGVDIGSPVAAFRIERVFDHPSVTSAYVRKLFDFSWCVNSEVVTFNVDGLLLSFQAGELLLKGDTINYRRTEKVWRVSYNLAFQKNITITYTGFSKSLTKRGWDHIWLRYQSKVSVPAGGSDSDATVATTPKFAYVERVYEYVDLNELAM